MASLFPFIFYFSIKSVGATAARVRGAVRRWLRDSFMLAGALHGDIKNICIKKKRRKIKIKNKIVKRRRRSVVKCSTRWAEWSQRPEKGGPGAPREGPVSPWPWRKYAQFPFLTGHYGTLTRSRWLSAPRARNCALRIEDTMHHSLAPVHSRPP